MYEDTAEDVIVILITDDLQLVFLLSHLRTYVNRFINLGAKLLCYL